MLKWRLYICYVQSSKFEYFAYVIQENKKIDDSVIHHIEDDWIKDIFIFEMLCIKYV